MENVLLIGNGVNLVDRENSLDWGQLLHKLKVKYGIQVELNNPLKPFPLSFEEMSNMKSGMNDYDSKLKNLKQSIKTAFFELLEQNEGKWHNEYHEKFMRLENINHILTTNYDYGFEMALDSDFLNKKEDFVTDRTELVNSLKRSYKLNKKIWHIHGELEDCRNHKNNSKNFKEKSILIGFDGYSNYLSRIVDTVKNKKKCSEDHWPYFFLNANVHIIGFGLDFSETHLWWLLQYRKRKGFTNEIYFYYANFINIEEKFNSIKIKNIDDILTNSDLTKELVKRKNNSAKIEVLKSLGVTTEPIECESIKNDRYKEFYDQVIQKLKSL
ncbi:SIR2 family protein [Psychroflexus sp. CAK8W]|uniref:SIR2 family protein n=1 Tax=Psychroflexus longus TaxID=2873596 RepID=A0ABS7XPI6_9FLAO|nr:SIR2 family protein [Psychroflexus longus]MBZ9779852.1 SIR2 family protein [Psychroflexus longus]